MGISETSFRVIQGITGTGDWKVYTIHGSRTLRPAWVPFFDDGAFVCILWSFGQIVRTYVLSVDAILFLAPISAFDQQLVEDPRVGCLEDSMRKWREICRNRQLAKVDLILWFNDLALLQTKLDSGIQLNKYLTQYKGPNTLVEVSKCEWSFPLPQSKKGTRVERY
jgi:hypothetical protein